MAVRQFRGVFGPVTTPFAANGDVDVTGFSQNVRAHGAAGLDGVVVNGSTGEAALLDEGERERLIEAAREAIGPDKSLIAGTGAESARLTINRSRRAATLGAEAVLVVAPHYYGDKMSARRAQSPLRARRRRKPHPRVALQHPQVHAFSPGA